MRTVLLLVMALACPAVAWPQSQAPATQELPSEAMLEFLGELEAIDDETWQLLEHHALKDVAENKEVNSE
ncbi:MAG: hypothetical protein OER87_02135 [Gammaproteobacteria bacterium]|nr:hypothetical protein [Gammaproteobacteria bacterium]